MAEDAISSVHLALGAWAFLQGQDLSDQGSACWMVHNELHVCHPENQDSGRICDGSVLAICGKDTRGLARAFGSCSTQYEPSSGIVFNPDLYSDKC